jgi:hypothetical protein
LAVGDDTIRVSRESLQNSVFEWCQVHIASVAMVSATPLQIDTDIPQVQHGPWRVAVHVTPQECASSRSNFRGAEWHFDTVIRTRVEYG